MARGPGVDPAPERRRAPEDRIGEGSVPGRLRGRALTLAPTTIARLRFQLDALDLILGEAAPEDLRRRSPSGKWSAVENLAHIARHHEVFLARLQTILAEERPMLPRYRAEEDPEWPAWAALSTEDVRARLQGARRALIAAVCDLDEAALARTAVHPLLGELAIPLWLEFFLLHEAHHLYVVMRRARGGE